MSQVILMDVDGVICNFVQGVIDSHKLEITHDEYTSWSYHKELGMSDTKFWKPASKPGWWRDLSPYPGALEFIEKVREFGEVIYCTAPSLSWRCPSEKVNWLRNNGFMNERRNDFMIGPRKDLMAGAGILIDDSDANVEKFRAAGGDAVITPRPWNELSSCAENSYGFVLKALGSLIESRSALSEATS